MKQQYTLTVLIALSIIQCDAHNRTTCDWVVIGAGPAGIATIGLLLDAGVEKNELLWIDPQFDVGRLGKYYTNVPGNSKAHTYQYFITQCSTFKEVKTDAIEELMKYNPNSEPLLKTIVTPLQDITSYLLHTIQVPHIVSLVHSLQRSKSSWHITLSTDQEIDATNVILATGCHPRVLDYNGPEPIDLDRALDKKKLLEQVDTHDTVAVIGSAHSAALILMYLHERSIPTIHFYKHPFAYKYDMGEGNHTTIAGLQGIAAQWVYHTLEKTKPDTIQHVYNNQENRSQLLNHCTKLVYAVGYVRNSIDGWNFDTLAYDNQCGVIEPHLFGIGLAFPQEVADYDGSKNYAIGLIDFMKYGQRVVPQWVAQHDAACSRTSLEKSFIITQL